MRYFVLIVIILFPNLVFAACSEKGATVVYINGIFTSLTDAREDLKKLREEYQRGTGDYDTSFYNGYNPSHLAGLGDLLQSAFQTFYSSASDFDRDTILLQIYPEVTTRKLLLIGHSQGSFYSNSIYDYLLNHGEPKGSVGVYNVASPASYTAGGGLYLTANQDTIIKWASDMANTVGGLQPLAPNTDLPLTIEQALETYPGHSFAGYYLQNSGSRIAGDLQFQLNRLTAYPPFDTDGCFTPPDNNLAYKTKQALFAVADPMAVGAVAGAKGAAVALGGIKNGLAATGSFFGSVVSAITPTPRISNLQGSYSVVGALYGSSVTEKNLKEFGLLEDQGGAVALAVSNEAEVKGVETQQPAESQEPPVVEPLIPPPQGVGGGYTPGFGGGGATVAVVAEVPVVAATSTATSTAATSTPPAAVKDGTPPSVVTLTINGTTLATTSPFATTPVATTTTTWSTVITFDEDISVAPTVKDGTPSFDFTNGTDQTVNDCSDSNAKTFCFTYAPPAGIEAAIFWFFRVSGARDVSGETLATTTYRFIVDTAGPALTLDASASNQTLPTVSGTSSFTSAAITLLLNAIQYSFSSPNGLWSFTVQPGSELAEATYPVVATSTDQYNNTVTYNWTLAVDTTYPVLGITSGPAEGGSVASTSPVSFTFSATDATALAYACAVDGGGSSTCSSPYSFSPAPGARSFAVTATDAAGNATTTTRGFVVLP